MVVCTSATNTLERPHAQEELEGPHDERIRQLEETIEKTRSMYFSAKRDAELSRNELEQALEDTAQDSEASQAAHKSQVSALQRLLAAKQAEHDAQSNEWGEKLRRVSLQKEAAAAHARKLESALQKAVRDADREQAESVKIRAEAKAAHVLWLEQRGSLEKSVKQLASEQASLRSIIARQQSAAAERTEQLQALQRSQTMDSRAAAERQQILQHDLIQSREQREREHEQKIAQVSDLTQSLAVCKAQLQAAQERIRQLESAAMISARQNAQSISTLQRKLEHAEAQDSQGLSSATPPLQAGMCITSEDELNTQLKTQTGLQTRLSAARTELSQQSEELHELRAQRVQWKQEQSALLQGLAQTQEKLTAAISNEARAASSAEKLSAEIETLQSALQSEQSRSQTLDKLQRENLEQGKRRRADFFTLQQNHSSALKTVKLECEQKLADVISRASAAEHAADAQKKKALVYKQKLLVLWKRFQDLQEAFATQESARRVSSFQQKERVDRLRRQLKASATIASEHE